ASLPATATCKPRPDPPPRLRRLRSRRPNFLAPWRNSVRRLCDTISPPPPDPSPRLRPRRSSHPNQIEPLRNFARRPCETTSPLPLDPSPRLRPRRSDDRVPPGTLRRLLLPSPSLPQSVFDRPWFVARPIERQRHSTPTEARISTDSLSYPYDLVSAVHGELVQSLLCLF